MSHRNLVMPNIHCLNFLPFYHLYSLFMYCKSRLTCLFNTKPIMSLELRNMSTQTDEGWEDIELPTSYGYNGMWVQTKIYGT